SLRDAALEVNHWCHEKVVYTPSDARTSSPLATVKTAYGRCGEESTFTVAALRSVGIPARQIYTPRWAHTDDNHAWVEVWVDGKWYFMGACEPEPALNLAWFNSPAARSMLMCTKVFGLYRGYEEAIETTACYTEINVTENYAPVAKTIVTVVDADSRPVENALVEFKIYNYAEFYSVARIKTDAEGRCPFSAGKGDMLVWATKDGRFGYGIVSFGKTGQFTITLNRKPGDEINESFDPVPPVEGNIPVEVTDAQKKANAKRLSEEDEIRSAYTGAFYTEEKAAALARALSIDEARTEEYMLKSRGNWAEIETFLRDATRDERPQAMALLSVVSAKDLRDTPATVWFDHLRNTPSVAENLCSSAERQNLFTDYVLNPRVANEFLTPYRLFFTTQIDQTLVKAARENPAVWADWVRQHITIRDELNPLLIPIMPAGVWKARMADARSRDIFFVASARSMGIPARLEPVTGKVQYYNNQWTDVRFDAAQSRNAGKGFVMASCQTVKALDNPKYYSHFTIARIRPDGQLQTLSFETEGDTDMGAGGTWAGILKNPLALDEGHYLLVSGMRMASGKALAQVRSFAVETDKTTSTTLVIREDDGDVQVIGSMDAEALFRTADSGEETSILSTTGRGYFVIGILGANQEPTNHAMRDIAQFKNDFEEWGRPMILLFGNEEGLQRFNRNEFGELPSRITYGVDTDSRIIEMIASATKLSGADALPVFIIADTFGRIVFVSQGYTIGLGEQMMKVIHKL
ncbi:MAG: transglutaminase-like domain-containing protein, partial [Tannerella sp.]|nr:transglutaminase-like domain-containing protein [Tannerella sp.]